MDNIFRPLRQLIKTNTLCMAVPLQNTRRKEREAPGVEFSKKKNGFASVINRILYPFPKMMTVFRRRIFQIHYPAKKDENLILPNDPSITPFAMLYAN